MNRERSLLILGAVALLVYHIILFVLAGFAGHGIVFWETYLFTIVAFLVIIFSACIRGMKKDWLFGYSIFLHNTVYGVLQLLLSAVFMLLDNLIGWQIPFIIQLVVLCVHLVFIASAFFGKKAAQELEGKVKNKTQYIRLLQADVELISYKCESPELKKKLDKLAEDIRFSDPMSSPDLYEIEEELKHMVMQMGKAVDEQENEKALLLCSSVKDMLLERNKKCKLLK